MANDEYLETYLEITTWCTSCRNVSPLSSGNLQPPGQSRDAGEARETLRGCFESTDWEVLTGPHGKDIKGLTHCITGYINFCVDNVVSSCNVTCFSNNKPWITRDKGPHE